MTVRKHNTSGNKTDMKKNIMYRIMLCSKMTERD